MKLPLVEMAGRLLCYVDLVFVQQGQSDVSASSPCSQTKDASGRARRWWQLLRVYVLLCGRCRNAPAGAEQQPRALQLLLRWRMSHDMLFQKPQRCTEQKGCSPPVSPPRSVSPPPRRLEAPPAWSRKIPERVPPQPDSPAEMVRKSAWTLVVLWVLYFVQGLPFGFQSKSLPLLLRERGFTLRHIGYANLLSVPWTCKFLVSPFVDRWGVGLPCGHRKAWILPMQCCLIVACLLAAWIFVRWPPPPLAQTLSSLDTCH
eukprot:COSAG06_NODE_12513_length_1371_cov_1.260220_1_plen_259_part_00